MPGPETITLPFTGFTLQGLNVEPSTITDFQGVTAQAYHVGTATGSDGLTYNLETDVEDLREQLRKGEVQGALLRPSARLQFQVRPRSELG